MQLSILKRPAYGFLTFLMMQVAVPFLGILILSILNASQGKEPISLSNLPIWATMLFTSLSGIFTVLLCIRPIGLVRCPKAIFGEWQSSQRIFLGLAGGVVAIFGVSILNDLLSLKDLLQTYMQEMAHSLIAWISICIVAPIVEELVMREGIQGYLTRNAVQPIWAILISSLLFGIMHMNPAQILAGFLMGVVLGILYQGTGNVRLCIALHLLNNTGSMIQYHLYPESTTASLTDFLGGRAIAIAIMLATFLLAAYLLRLFLQKTKQA